MEICVPRPFAIFVAAVALAGCVSAFNNPINDLALVPSEGPVVLPELPAGQNDTTVIGLGFSGGGTRAAAFAYGMLQELQATPAPGYKGKSMLDLVHFISGVSGGSVTAAYYGLKGKQGYTDLREKFLIRDGEATMRTDIGPVNLLRAFQGGVNDQKTFGGWLDKNVFEGATFSDMWKPGRPIVWINASDLYNRTPFIFNRETFAALCSDLGSLRLAEAVSASAAVPIVFTPIVVETHRSGCSYRPPAWLATAKTNPSAPATLKAHAAALENYRDAEKLKYVKLVDGGITDNYGVTGVTLARAASLTAYGPFSAKQAVRIERVIYLVSDASQGTDVEWGSTVKGPNLQDMVMAIADTAINNSVREGFDAFRATMQDWQDDIIEFRCSLSEAEVLKLRGSLTGWNCRDIKFFITSVSSATADPALRLKFEEIKTRLKLPVDEVDTAIATGRQALKNNPIFMGALRNMKGIDTDGGTDGFDLMTPSASTTRTPAPETASN
jgi:NTE family protein